MNHAEIQRQIALLRSFKHQLDLVLAGINRQVRELEVRLSQSERIECSTPSEEDEVTF